jgi:hypothetical protein
MLAIIATIVTVVCTVTAIIISYIALRESHSDKVGQKREAALKQAIKDGTSELSSKLNLLDNQFTGFKTDFISRVDAIVMRALHPHDISLTQVSTKIDLFQAQLAAAMAQFLHQPDPARMHIDVLLESFMEGTITPAERSELREHLGTICAWEPGKPSPYPIHPGEQVAAAILLSTMDAALAAREANG